MARAVFLVLVLGVALVIVASILPRTHEAGIEKAVAGSRAGSLGRAHRRGPDADRAEERRSALGRSAQGKGRFDRARPGIQVLTVPVEDIQERRLESQAAADLKPEGGSDRIYTEVDPRALQERPVKALADELGGSVALVQTPAALGSCFAIDERGYFVTNCHVIQGEQEISIKLFRKGDGRLGHAEDRQGADRGDQPVHGPGAAEGGDSAGRAPPAAAAGFQRFDPERTDGLRHRQPARAGTDGLAGDRQRQAALVRGTAFPADDRGDQPGQFRRAALRPARRGRSASRA